ncbi:hypothetical protein D3C76_172410 [compost metagenome]
MLGLSLLSGEDRAASGSRNPLPIVPNTGALISQNHPVQPFFRTENTLFVRIPPHMHGLIANNVS